MVDRAQSTTIGFVLLIAVTMIGATAVVALGGQSFDDTRETVHADRVEHGMTQFDSRAALVALGSSPSQTVSFGSGGGGTFAVDEDAGWLRVTHRNYTGEGTSEELYNATLGAVRYRDGDTTVTYQGGGVWRGTGTGSVMVSPPEFHYRSATLTLPVTRVRGAGGAGGSAVAHITSDGGVERVYPNESKSYSNDRPYSNPVENGTIEVTVHSDYYRAWAGYFRTRTEGNVTTDDGNRTAHVVLETGDQVGAFELPSRSNALEVRGMASGHAVRNFSVTLKPGNNFNNMYYSFSATEGTQELELLVHVPGGIGGKPCKRGNIDDDVTLAYDVYYADGSGDHHAWTSGSVDGTDGPIRLQCGDDGVELRVGFTGDTPLTYGSFNTTNDPSKWHHDWEGDVQPHADFNHTGDDADGESTRFSDGDGTTSRHLVRHYLALLGPNVDLTVNYGPGNSPRVDPDSSFGVLEYDTAQSPRYITYLHVTENRISVEFVRSGR